MSKRLETTTETDDKAMARPAAHGGRRTPTGVRTPAAIGMPVALKPKAQMKLRMMRLYTTLDRWMVTSTSSSVPRPAHSRTIQVNSGDQHAPNKLTMFGCRS